MKTDERTFSDYVALLRRRRGVAAAVGAPIFLGLLITAFALPAVYESTATIQIQRPQIPEAMVQTTVAAYAEELLATVTQQVLATDSIIDVIERFDLYPDKRDTTLMDDLAREFRSNTAVVSNTASAASPYGRNTEITYAFTVSFRYSDANLAAEVANDLARLHTEVNNSLRADRAARTSQFLNVEAKKVERQIEELEEKIASLAGSSFGALAQNPMMASQRFEQLDRELAQVDESMRAARERRDLIETEMAQTPRFRPNLGTGQPMMTGTERLAEAQQELVALQAKYSADHPDVVRLKREIATLTGGSSGASMLASELRASLRAAEQELAAARQSYSDDHPDVVRLGRRVTSLQQQLDVAEQTAATTTGSMSAPDNPVYLSLMTRLRGADQEIANLTSRRAGLSSRMGGFYASPEMEARFASLMQERQVLQEEHRGLRAKLSEATLAEVVEAEKKGQILTTVDPAREATFPIEPNRPMLILLGLVLGLFGAFGSASLADAADTRVRGVRDIEALLEMTPMAVIPYIDGPGEAKARISKRVAIGLAMSALFAALIVFLMAR